MQAAAKKINEQQQLLQKNINILDKLILSLNEPFEELDQQVEKELVTLSISIAQQIIRREIKIDPGQIMAVIREALEVLPVASRNIKISLHPEDAALVEQLSSASQDIRQWQLVEDPTLMRGGCTVTTDTSRIDATVESRLAAIFSQILGGEREQDQSQT
jgi:flagellar assembly protein FliH